MDDDISKLNLNNYYLESLRAFCRRYRIPVKGKKSEKIEQIQNFLRNLSDIERKDAIQFLYSLTMIQKSKKNTKNIYDTTILNNQLNSNQINLDRNSIQNGTYNPFSFLCVCNNEARGACITCSKCNSFTAHKKCINFRTFICPHCWIKTFSPTVTFLREYIVVPYTLLSHNSVKFTIETETKINLNTKDISMLCMTIEHAGELGYSIDWTNTGLTINGFRIASDDTKTYEDISGKIRQVNTLKAVSFFKKAFVCIFLVKNNSFAETVEQIRLQHPISTEEAKSILSKRINLNDSDNEDSDSINYQRKMSNNDELIEAVDMKYSLLCPIGLSRMSIPCKSFRCKHIRCFDLKTYLEFYSSSYQSKCPICSIIIGYNDLQIDPFIEEILKNTTTDEVLFHSDMSYKEVHDFENQSVQSLISDSDSDEEDSSQIKQENNRVKDSDSSQDVIELLSSDSSSLDERNQVDYIQNPVQYYTNQQNYSTQVPDSSNPPYLNQLNNQFHYRNNNNNITVDISSNIQSQQSGSSYSTYPNSNYSYLSSYTNNNINTLNYYNSHYDPNSYEEQFFNDRHTDIINSGNRDYMIESPSSIHMRPIINTGYIPELSLDTNDYPSNNNNNNNNNTNQLTSTSSPNIHSNSNEQSPHFPLILHLPRGNKSNNNTTNNSLQNSLYDNRNQTTQQI